MPYNYDDEERERPDWSEIDKMKDRSKHVDKEKQERETPEKPKRTSYAHKKYKEKLEEFFSLGKKKEDKIKNEELKKIKEIKNRSLYMKAATEYIEKNGYPKDLDFLLTLLDHKETEKIMESIKVIEDLYKGETDTRKDIIKQKIHILEMTASDPKIQQLAEEALERMKSL